MAGQLGRFVLVGLVNTGVYYGLYLLLKPEVPYLAAHVVAFAFSVVVSFFLSCWVTYRVRPTVRKFVRFPLSTLTNFVVTTVGLYVLVEEFGVSRQYAPLLAAAAAVPATFITARFILVDRHVGEVAEEVVPRAPLLTSDTKL